MYNIINIFYIIIYFDIYITISETINYLILSREENLRKYYLLKAPLSASTLLSIVIANYTIYLIVVRSILEFIGIKDYIILSLFLSFIDNAITNYYLFSKITKFEYMLIVNRFIFNAIIYNKLLQFNNWHAIIAYSYIIFMCGFIRYIYPNINYYVKLLGHKFMDCKEIKSNNKREYIFAK